MPADPAAAAFHLRAARQALQRGDAAAARDALAQAHAADPDDTLVAFEHGSQLLQQGAAAAARPLLRAAMIGMPSDARAAFRYGAAGYATGDLAAAVEGFAAATQRKPDWFEAWNNLAAAHGAARDYAPAIVAARQALRLRPQAAAAHQALSALLSNLSGREALREGLAAAERALRIDPALAAAHRDAAIVLRKLGEPQRAQAHAQRALALDPANPDAVDLFGEQLLANRDPAQAAATYAHALARGVDTPVLRRQHGIALLQQGDARAATERLSDALRAAPADQRAIAHLASALIACGEGARATEMLGLHRHVQAVALPPPPGFADADAFHRALAADIRAHSQQRWEPPGLAARNAYLGGDLLADRTPAIVGFELRLREAIDAFIAARRADPGDLFLRNVPAAYRLHVWATLAAESGFIDTHIHEDSWLSGAYYVELPDAVADDDPAHAGWIEFGRPYAHLPQPDDAHVRAVRPRVGTLLLFPSFLFHRTLPYRGAGERISISFDLAAA